MAQPSIPLYATPESCTGKTFIVTGANNGLGLDASQHLVAAGASRVIMAVRNPTSGQAALSKIEASTGKRGVAQVWALDLASYASVKAFAGRAAAELDRIDALVENAGIFSYSMERREGHAEGLTVNVLSTFLLGVLLLPKLAESARKHGNVPHLTFVSSSYGYFVPEEWQSIKDDPIVKLDAGDDFDKLYRMTKMLDLIAGRQLAAEVPFSRTGVVINVICPGFAKTGLDRHGHDEARASNQARLEMYGISSEEGSRRLLHAALAGKESHGHFLKDGQVHDGELPAFIADEAALKDDKRVWGLVAAELEKAEPGCVEAVRKLGQ